MSEYTPTTDQIREFFALAMVPSGGDQTVPEGEFDAWLAEHDREVQARAWDEGYAKGLADGYFGTKDEKNPYRTPTEEKP